MKKPSSRLGCVLVVLLAAISLVLVGAAWWFFIGQYTMAPVGPSSPVQVFLLSPSSGDDVAAGDLVLVDLQAVAPEAISWSEVFVDGTSLGALTESPERASWTWQAWPTGIHVLSGRAQAADGQLGESQTVILNVIAVNETMQVQAADGQTLGDVGAKFAVPPDQMAGANPGVDPSKPLAGGKPVNIPTGGAKPQPPSGGGSPGGNTPGAGSIPFLIQWELKLTGQVDKSYCYLSDGSGAWDKMPKQPFEFFGGLDNLYTQVFDVTPPTDVTIQAQCWGWLGGALKYLGQGVTTAIGNGPIQVIGEGFTLNGLPKFPEGKEFKPLGGGGLTVPAPFALRQPKDTADCTAHALPILGPFICNTLMNAKVKEYLILEWEWQPGLPGTVNWVNDIAGYELYEILPDTEAPAKYIKNVKPGGAKAAALPLQWWDNRCYGVRAFAEGPKYGGKIVSEMVTYCPGAFVPLLSVHLYPPSAWLTAVDMLDEGDECNGIDLGKSGYKNGVGEVFAGAYDAPAKYTDCYENVYYTGAVEFNTAASPLPPAAAVQKAILRFSPSKQYFNEEGAAWYGPESCIWSVGKATKAWSGLSDADHWIYQWGLGGYGTPMVSVPEAGPIALNVTSVVKDWVKNPANNHGFIIYGDSPPGGSGGSCISSQTNWTLDIYYFAP